MYTHTHTHAVHSGVFPRSLFRPVSSLFLSLVFFYLCLFLTRRSVPRASFYPGSVANVWYTVRRFSVSVRRRGHYYCRSINERSLHKTFCTLYDTARCPSSPSSFFDSSRFLCFFFSLFLFFPSLSLSLSLSSCFPLRRARRRQRLQKRAAGSRTVTATIMTQRRRCDGLPRRRRKNVGGDNAGATPSGDSTRAQVANVYDND